MMRDIHKHRLRTKVVCSHHNTVLVFNREDACSVTMGCLRADRFSQGTNGKWDLTDWVAGLPLQDILSVVGPLVNRMGSVDIKGVVPL